MKPFNLEEAKAGKPVCTRDGEQVEILYWNLKSNNWKPIVAIIKGKDGGDDKLYTFACDGKLTDCCETSCDLMMESVHHEGWVALLKEGEGELIPSLVYNTKEELEKYLDDEIRPETLEKLVSITKIEWEE